jgi:hypothetical protein
MRSVWDDFDDFLELLEIGYSVVGLVLLLRRYVREMLPALTSFLGSHFMKCELENIWMR